MPDVDQLVLALRAPLPPPHPPAIPIRLRLRRLHRAGVLATAAAAAAAAVVLVVPDAPRVTGRGPEAAIAVTPELRMLVVRGGLAVRIGDGGIGHVGEQVYFRAQGAPDRTIQLTVEGPEGHAVLWEGDGTGGAVDVGSGSGLLAYAFDQPGQYSFVLADGGATAPAVRIQVQ